MVVGCRAERVEVPDRHARWLERQARKNASGEMRKVVERTESGTDPNHRGRCNNDANVLAAYELWQGQVADLAWAGREMFY